MMPGSRSSDPAGFRVVGSGPDPDLAGTKMSRSGLDLDPAGSENCGSGALMVPCCFNTLSSNTGVRAGAGTPVKQMIDTQLLCTA